MFRRIAFLFLVLFMSGVVAAQENTDALPPVLTTENVSDLDLLYTLSYQRDAITDVVFVESLSLISTSEDNSWIVWDLRTGRLSTPNRNVLGNRISAFAINVDDEEEVMNGLAVQRRDDGVLIVSTTTNLLTVVTAHAGEIVDLALSQDWRYAATVGEDSRAVMWGVGNGQLLREWVYDVPAAGVAFTPGNRQLVIAVGDVIELHTIEGEAEMQSWPLEIGTLIDMDTIAHEEEDALIAAVASENGWAVLDLTDDAPSMSVADLDVEPVQSVALSPNANLIALATGDAIVIYDAVTGDLLTRLDSPEGTLSRVAFSPDDTMLVAGGSSSDVYVWAVPDSE